MLLAVEMDAFVCESASASGVVTSSYRQFPRVTGYVHDLNPDRVELSIGRKRRVLVDQPAFVKTLTDQKQRVVICGDTIAAKSPEYRQEVQLGPHRQGWTIQSQAFGLDESSQSGPRAE